MFFPTLTGNDSEYIVQNPSGDAERRKKQRIYESLPATVYGRDADGKRFQLNTNIDNLSAGGLYVRLPRTVIEKRKVNVTIRLSTDKSGTVPASQKIETRGVVVRSDPMPSGEYGVAIKFTSYKFV